MTSRSAFRAISLVAFWAVLAVSVNAGESSRGDSIPAWSVGTKWQVEVIKMTEPPSLPKEMLEKFKPEQATFVFQFTVETLADIDSERCFRVRIDQIAVGRRPPGPPVEFWRIYVRQANYTLKRIERLAVKTENIEASRSFESGPVDATDWVGYLPLAFPAFDGGKTGQEPPVRISKKGNVEFKPPDRCRQTEEVARIRVDNRETDAMKMTLEKEPGDGLSRRTTQTWIKGMPWWVEASHDRDGHQWCSARLLKN